MIVFLLVSNFSLFSEESSFERASDLHSQSSLTFSLLKETIVSEIEKALLEIEGPFSLVAEKGGFHLSFPYSLEEDKILRLQALKNRLEEKDPGLLESFSEIQTSRLKALEEEIHVNEDPKLYYLKESLESISFSELEHLFGEGPFFHLTLCPQNEDLELFLSLSFSEDEKHALRELLKSLANQSVFEIMSKQSRLLHLKEKLRSVHPLRILAFIFGDPSLKGLAKKIAKADVKWVFLTGGLERSMKRKHEKDLLIPYIEGFSQVLSLDSALIQGYVDRGAYGAFFRYLVSL